MPMLQFPRRSASHAHGWWEIRWRNADNIPDAHLHLVIASTGMMMLREKHQHMMRDHVSLIGMAREHHLPIDSLLGSRDRHLFPVVTEQQFPCFAAHNPISPQHQRDDASA